MKSSLSSAGHPAANAVDGDVGTKWRTGIRAKNGDWFQVDLGGSKNVSKIVLKNSEHDAFESIAEYQVYVSDDGVDGGAAVARGNGHLGTVSISLAPEGAVRQHRELVPLPPALLDAFLAETGLSVLPQTALINSL